MDFSYENGGPSVHGNSPFGLASLKKSLLHDAEPPRKRPHFETSSQTSSRPSFVPNGESKFLFSTPANLRHFTIPRNTVLNDANPSSSDRNDADSEGTPLTRQVSRRPKLSHLVSRKVRRRRERESNERDFWNGNVGDSEDEQHFEQPNGGSRSVSGHAWEDPNAWQETHRNIPYIVSGYLQLAFNIALVLVLLYLLLAFVQTIQRDVDQKVEEYSAEILQEMSLCSKEYLENRCTPGQRVPAMEAACITWEKCMNRDPTVVGRAKVSAETFAEIVNSFIEPISYKTMVSLLVKLNFANCSSYSV